MIKYTKYLIIFLFIFDIAYAQHVKSDTTNLNFKDQDEYEIGDSIHNNIKYIPGDLIFVPSGVLYDNQWENRNIKYRKVDIAGKKDTTLVLFNTSPDNNFYFPIKGKLLSPFGYRGHHFHTGVDIRLCHNDSVYSVMAGKVRISKRFKGYGNAVVVRHYNGLETVYAHLNKLCVKVDDEIKAGDLVGLGGRTGRATADHLHFETRFLEQPINPMTFIDFDNFTLKKDTLILTATTFSTLASAPNKPYNRSKKKGSKTKKAAIVKKDTSKMLAKKDIEEKPEVKTEVKNNEANPKPKSVITSKSKKYYTVKSGDTLYEIARKNNTSVNKLCHINGISKKKILKPGMKIKIA